MKLMAGTSPIDQRMTPGRHGGPRPADVALLLLWVLLISVLCGTFVALG